MKSGAAFFEGKKLSIALVAFTAVSLVLSLAVASFTTPVEAQEAEEQYQAEDQYRGQEDDQPEATTASGDDSCPTPEVVETVSGTGNQQSAPFDIEGERFLITSEVVSTAGPNSFLFSIFVEDTNDELNLTLVDQEQEGTQSSFVNEGPGSFFLDITAIDAEYEITVEDCTGTDNDDGTDNDNDTDNTDDADADDDVIQTTIPDKSLPNTGGLPLAGAVLAGFSLVSAGFLVRRRR